MNLSYRNSSSEWVPVMLQLVCLPYEPGVVVIQRVQQGEGGQGPLADDGDDCIQQYTTRNLTHTDMRKHDIVHTCIIIRLYSLNDKSTACMCSNWSQGNCHKYTCKSRVDKARLNLNANTCTKNFIDCQESNSLHTGDCSCFFMTPCWLIYSTNTG